MAFYVGGCMGTQQEEEVQPPSPWVRAVVVLLTLAVGGYGVICLIRGRLVSEDVVLTGAPARIVGAVLAALAIVSLLRSIYRWRKSR
jgi:hypothetical protein